MLLYRFLTVVIIQYILVNAVPIDLSDISDCTLSCLTQTFSNANCSLFDTHCQCSDQELVYSTSTCLLQECPLKDSVALGKLRDEICGRAPVTRQHSMLVVNLSMGSLSTLIVALRLLSRYLVGRKLWADDYLILGAMAVNIPSIATGAWMQLNGLGQHIWYLPVTLIPKILRLFYASETLYLLILNLTKISILLFYLRIFPRRRFRIATYVTLGFVILAGIVILFLQLFQCMPIAYNWDRSIKTGKCLNVNILSYTHAGMSILQDFMILLLPIPELLRLKMKTRSKLGVVFIFQIGLFACVTSIVRLRALTQFDGTKTIDPTWDNVGPTIWTAAEINTAIICASLPALRPLLRSCISRHLDSGHARHAPLKGAKSSPSPKPDDASTTQALSTAQCRSDTICEANEALPPTDSVPTIGAHQCQCYYDSRSDSKDDMAPLTQDTEFASDVLSDFGEVREPACAIEMKSI